MRVKKFNGFIGEDLSEFNDLKDSKLTDKQWVELVRLAVDYAHKGLRLGQSYMNALLKVDKKLYDEIDGTDSDPFYDDNKIINFIKFLSN